MPAASERLKVFTFWEPRAGVTPYLQLCRETWDRGLKGREIVVLDYANLDEYLDPGALDLDALTQLGLPAQKDAVMIAVLHRHGGLFMDMDTLVVDDLSPILRLLGETGVVMFEQHVAFVAARKGAALLTLWLAGIRKNLARISTGEVDPAGVRWDYLGNAPLNAAYLELIDRSLLLRTIRRTAVGRRAWPSAAAVERQRHRSNVVTPSTPPLWKRLGRAWIRARVADQLIRLDRAKDGFIAEAWNPGPDPLSPADAYRRFWFDTGGDTSSVLRPGVRVIGLHHSWTPNWYCSLSREEVLNHGCRLSRALARLRDLHA